MCSGKNEVKSGKTISGRIAPIINSLQLYLYLSRTVSKGLTGQVCVTPPDPSPLGQEKTPLISKEEIWRRNAECRTLTMGARIDVHTYIRTYVHTYIQTYIRTYDRTYVRTYMHTCMNFLIRGCGAGRYSTPQS